MTPSLPLAVVATALSSDLRTAARAARVNGFRGLLLDTEFANGQLLALSQTGQREVRHILAAQDQTLVALDARLPGKGFRPESDIEAALDHLDRILAAARGLQAAVVSLDLGPLPPAPRQPVTRPRITPEQAGLIIIPTAPVEEPEPEPAAPPDPAFLASLTDALRELGRRADRYGVTLAFHTQLAGFAALEQALHTADCPWFGVDLDPVSVLEDAWPLDEVFSRLGSLIRHVRGRDALRGADRRTQPAPIGQGDTDWPALLHALDQAGYHGWITIDPIDLPDRAAATRAALQHLAPSSPAA